MKPIITDWEDIDNRDTLLEQDPPEAGGGAAGGGAPAGGGGEPAGGAGGDVGGDIGGAGGGEDIFGGGGEPEPEYSLTDIGRVYILKKIYESLRQLLDYAITIQNLKTSKTINKVISDIVQARDLFILLSSNIDKYLDRLDSIIDEYRKFIKSATSILYKYAEENNLLSQIRK